jgi:hypothetical protein
MDNNQGDPPTPLSFPRVFSLSLPNNEILHSMYAFSLSDTLVLERKMQKLGNTKYEK